MTITRRLAAILAADVAGYSRLMRADEDGTISALTTCRAIVDSLIAEHRGRIANTAGDSVLAEFPSVVDGLYCALAVQRAIAKHNEGFPRDRQMMFRMGIHLGEIMIKDGDLFGSAVNITARLQSLAEPGGICVSAAVREHVGTRLGTAFIDAGAQRVKNIAEPLHVFRVATTGTAQHGEQSAALPSLDKPSVAVLPFTSMSADPEQEFFADGIAEDIITALSRYPSLFVIARNSCFTYKGRVVDVKQVGQELGVRYVLEGSLRKAGNRIRVTAQLIEAETGNHVWAERYDRDLADIFAVQDRDGGDDRNCAGRGGRRAAARHAQTAGKPERVDRVSARALAFGQERRGRQCSRTEILSAGDRSRPQLRRRLPRPRLCSIPGSGRWPSDTESARSAEFGRDIGASGGCA
jgi:adenylate cyclase